MKITFLGGVGTVTGSKYLIDTRAARVLVDCGLFQGFKNLRLRNREPLPVDPATVDAVVLTHAHLDHSGYLPLLCKNGFRGDVVCTEATRDLCEILLPDSGYLQEKDAEFANRHRFSKHKPALPLYTLRDAKASLEHFRPVPFGREFEPVGGVKVRFLQAGHILGASIVEILSDGIKLVFSGDLGRSNDAIMVDPTPIQRADYLIVESTYGDRSHDPRDPEDALADIVNRTIERGGSVIIPAFAVGRAQSVMFHIMRLKAEGRIPSGLPVFLDSPMAINASEVYCTHAGEHRLTATECRTMCNVAKYVREVEDSKAIDADPMPKIVISASGMATGGRVLHHLKHYAPDHRNTVLFTGFQAGGTRGAVMLGGAESVKIHGQYVPIRAEVLNLKMLSAHADGDAILDWLGHFRAPPKRTFVTHGEPIASDTLRRRIEEELGWSCRVPEYREEGSLP